MTKKISKEISIYELISSFPEKREQIVEAMSNIGLGCIGCAAASFETLEEGLLAHGKTEQEINTFIQKLNQIISN